MKTEVGETVCHDTRTGFYRNPFGETSLEDIRGFYEFAVEEYDIETFKKTKYKMIFEEETEICAEDYNLMSYFVDIKGLGSFFNIKNGVLSQYLGDDIDLYIPDGVTEIADNAFRMCGCFKSVVIPSTVTRIPSSFCNVRHIEVSKDNPKYYIQDGCLINREKKELVWAYSGSTIPDDGSVVKIGNKAFAHRYDLFRIVIPEAITEIGDDAFCYCDFLKEIMLPRAFVDDAKRIFGRRLVKSDDKWTFEPTKLDFLPF